MPRLWLGLAVVLLAGAWRCVGTAPGSEAAAEEWDIRVSSSDGTAKEQAEFRADTDAAALRDLLWQALLAARDAPRMAVDSKRIREMRAGAYVEIELRPPLSGELVKWKKAVTASHLLLPLGAKWKPDSAYILHGNPAYGTGQVYLCEVDGAALRELLERLWLPVPTALPAAEEAKPTTS